MPDETHECNSDGCEHKAKLAWEMAAMVMERLDGRKVEDALDLLGQVSAILQATAYANMKGNSIETSVVDSWREWRDSLVMEMEEDMVRQKKDSDGKS